MTVSLGLPLLGVNLSGPEFTPQNLGGEAGYAYVYPTHAEVDYFAAKGMNVIRLPFLWERVQPVQGGPLDAQQLSYLDGIVSYATARGVKVVLDVHNYGSGYGNLIGSAGTPNAAFADLWGRLASHFAGNDDVLFGLMNEPHRQTAAQWVESANAAIAAIRATGATQQILVPGTYWTGAHSWVSSDNDTVLAPGIVDPGRNFAFEVHQYLDADSSGTQPGAVSAQIGVERLTAITQWAEATGNRLFLGEFGADRSEVGLTGLSNMLAYMKAHPVWQGATYWAAGPWWGDYMFSVEPVGLGSETVIDRPQMDVLENFLDDDKGVSIRGTDGADTLRGRTGPDVIDGLQDADGMYGGAGNDTYFVDHPADKAIEAVRGGTDTVKARIPYKLPAGQEIESLVAIDAAAKTKMNLSGNEFAQTITGNAGTNILRGGGGNDVIDGGGGIDTVDYRDKTVAVEVALNGGTAVGVTVGGIAEDRVVNVESVFGGSAADKLTGDGLANVLDGWTGADTLIGGGGSDTYFVDDVGDRVVEARRAGADKVLASVSYTLAAGQEIESLATKAVTGTAAIDLTGNEFANTIAGNAGANVLDGGLGKDTLTGHAGADTFVFRTALSTANIDRLTDFSAADDTLQLSKDIFTALSGGPLATTAFKDLGVAGAKVDADDRILYDPIKGVISYDADGSGKKAVAVPFAIVETKAVLTGADFFVI